MKINMLEGCGHALRPGLSEYLTMNSNFETLQSATIVDSLVPKHDGFGRTPGYYGRPRQKQTCAVGANRTQGV